MRLEGHCTSTLKLRLNWAKYIQQQRQREAEASHEPEGYAGELHAATPTEWYALGGFGTGTEEPGTDADSDCQPENHCNRRWNHQRKRDPGSQLGHR